MKKFLKYGLGGLVVLLVIGVAGYYAWSVNSIARPTDSAIAALVTDDQVRVEDGRFLVFRPARLDATTGVIFYPGANCDVRGYAPVLRRIAARGYLVVDVRMPLNQAIFAPNRADDVREAFPAIQRWVIAGHSMGGAMASHYAHNHPDDLAGLILFDGRPTASDTLVNLRYPVWHIHRATLDGRPPDKLERFHNLFPASSTWVPIRGGIHMQFGSFNGGGYTEEWKPQISADEQHDQAVTATLNALLTMAPPPAT